MRWRIANFAESTTARTVFVSLVLLNGILIGVEADNPYEGSNFWEIIEYIFVTIFTFEISIKLVGFGLIFWTDWWNVMDFLIVLASVVDLFIKGFSGTESSGVSVLRLLRVLRVVRLIGFLEKLNLLAMAFIEALKSVAWVMILVLIVVYIFAVLGQGFFSDLVTGQDGTPPCPNNRPDCIEAWFGTVTFSMLALFQVMTMDSWSDMARVIGVQHEAAWIYFVIFVALAGLGMMNLLTAVFVEALLEQTASHERKTRAMKEANRQEALNLVANAFAAFDEDGNGVLDAEELAKVKEALDTIEARKMFEDLGLPVDEIIRAISQAAEQGGMLERIDYQEMLVRIDKMHLTPEKEDIWQVENQITKIDEKTIALASQVQQLQTDMGQIQSDVGEILRLLKHKPTELLPVNEFT